MKPICIVVLLAITGCSCSQEQQYTHGLILRDKTGCAFAARKGAGDIVFLVFNKQESSPTCEFKP